MESVFKLLLYFTLICSVYSSQKGVPAVIWSTENSNFPASLTGHSIDVKQFKDDYLSPQQNMLLFMQDKLSMEDFTQHADVYNENTDGATFHNLKSIMEKHASSHVSSLMSSESLPDIMKGMAQQVHTLSSPYNVQELPVNEKSGHLVIVDLPETSGLHTKDALKKIDGIIQSVHDQMKAKKVPFTAVYTAKASSKPAGASVLSSLISGRHLLQTEQATSNASFWNLTDGCLYLYAEAVVFEVYKISPDTKRPDNIQSFTLPATDQYDSSSECGGNSTKTAKLVVKYSNPGTKQGKLELSNFEFTMDFSTNLGYWTLNSMKITYTAKVDDDTTTYELKGSDEKIENRYTRDIFAPSGYSYHCSYQEPFQPNTTAVDGWFVQVKTVQLQTQFNGAQYNGPFGQVNDCIGFFTIPIWSSLIAMSVLLAIFFFGMAMLTSVNTQDRFDDPKGKNIQVNVSE